MRSTRINLTITVCALLALCSMVTDALATDYFVRKTGNDGNAGTTSGTAWLTVDHAADNVAAGDTIYIGAGTYTEDVVPAASCVGTAINPIRFIGDLDGSQTGDAGDILITASATYALHLDVNGHDYLEFHDLKFSGGSAQSVYSGASTAILFDNCEVYGSSNEGLRFDNHTVTIRNCSFHDNTTSGINLQGGATATIEDSSVYANSNFGAMYITGSSTATLVRCRIYDNLTEGINVYGATLTVTNCLVYGNTGTGVVVDSDAGNVVDIQNCTIADNTNSGMQLDAGTNTVTNCIFADNGNYGILDYSSSTRLNNLIDGNVSGNTAANSTEIVADPQFVSSTDYRVRTLSPAFNAGADLTGTVDDDIDGAARPYDSAWDIGCYEMAPEGHWKLDETSGTTAADSSGRGNDGTYTGSPTLGVAAKYATAVDFDGSNYVEIAGKMGEPKNVTLMAWIDLDVTDSNGSTAINIGNLARIQIDKLGLLQGVFYDGTTSIGVNYTKTLATTGWHHVAVTFDDDADTAVLYLDGEEVATATITQIDYSGGDNTTVIGTEAGGGAGSSSADFDGRIDDARIYSYAMNAAEVEAFFSGLVGHWKLDETSGSAVADSSGLSNDSTVTGTATWNQAIKSNGLELDYTDGEDYVEIPNSPSMENVQEGSYTLAAWFMPASTPPGSGGDNDASYSVVRKEGWSIGLFYDNLNRFKMAHYLDGNVYAGTNTYSSNPYLPGKFYHVAGVVDRSAGTTKIYVDGKLANTNTFTPGTAARDFGTNPWLLGISKIVSASYRWAAEGTLDDARIYNRALTDDEIIELYGLMGHWKLDETSGTVAADSSGLGNDGTVNGTGTWKKAVKSNGLDVDYTDGEDYVEIPTPSTLLEDIPVDSYTVAAWFKPDSVPPGAGSSDNDASYGIVIRKNLSTGISYNRGKFRFDHWVDDGSGPSSAGAALSSTASNAGRFYHVVGVLDRDAGTIKLYVDGVLRDTNTFTPGTAGYGHGTQPWLLGIASPGAANYAWAADGVIDDARIYNRALGDTEIAELYGLMGHWKLDETSGTVAADSSAFGRDGTYTDSPTLGEDGVYEKSVDFDGTNSVQISSNMGRPKNVTLAAWVDLDVADAAGSTVISISERVSLYVDVGSPTLRGLIYDGTTSHSFYFYDKPLAGTGWRHVALTFDDDADTVKLYLDGQEVTTGTLAASIDYSGSLGSSKTRLAQHSSSGGYDFDGRIDDARVYNRALSQEEISELFGLQAHWKLDETSGTVAVDATCKGNEGTFTNGVVLNQSGNIDQAADFDGSDDYVTVADDPNLQMDDVFSLTMWIRSDNSSNPYRLILNKEGEYQIAISSSNELMWAIANTDPGWGWHTTGHIVALGKWTHIALTYDNGTVSSYANGILVDTYSGSGTVGDVYSTFNELRIAGRTASPGARYFDGRIDDLRVYSRELSQGEIFSQYKNGRPDGIRIIKWVEVR